MVECIVKNQCMHPLFCPYQLWRSTEGDYKMSKGVVCAFVNTSITRKHTRYFTIQLRTHLNFLLPEDQKKKKKHLKQVHYRGIVGFTQDFDFLNPTLNLGVGLYSKVGLYSRQYGTLWSYKNWSSCEVICWGKRSVKVQFLKNVEIPSRCPIWWE